MKLENFQCQFNLFLCRCNCLKRNDVMIVGISDKEMSMDGLLMQKEGEKRTGVSLEAVE